ncbi:DinB family protein [Streptomyces sp. NPDC059271]|uniref:DinB family protein n=1 Tax=Streptomyces sp. NPDC059271 TaxID=3346799 RepID=UPI0036B5F1B1
MNDFVRVDPPRVADEKASLTGFLDFQRETLAMKCAGLTDEQLATASVPPSELTLLGLVRHLADVERHWFQRVMGSERPRGYWHRPGREYAGFAVEDADAATAFAVWSSACSLSRDITAASASLDDLGTYRGESFSLRFVLTHMIEEYARHNGHADFLRERIDGATGE